MPEQSAKSAVSGKYVVILLLAFLTACTSGPAHLVGLGEISLPLNNASRSNVHNIFVATSRARSIDPRVFFSGERSTFMHLGNVDVSVPASHKIGNIERPQTGTVDASKHFTIGQPTVFAESEEFVAKLNIALARRPKGQRDVLVFVHGYNTHFSSAVLRMAQFVHDVGFEGVPVLFTWASRGKAIDYVYDMNSALQARYYLQELSVMLSRSNAEGFGIVAHSMGNLVALEAMAGLSHRPDFRPKAPLKGVMLAAPDVDFDLFVEQLRDLGPIKPKIHVLVSSDDRALSLSKLIAGGVSRVGAADPTDIASLGLKVVDLSQINDRSSSHHSKFADSPAIVQMIGRGINAGNTLTTSTSDRAPTSKLVGSLFKEFRKVTSRVVGSTDGGVLTVAD